VPAVMIGERIIDFRNGDGYVEVDGRRIEYSVLSANETSLVVRIGNAFKEIFYLSDGECIDLFTDGHGLKFRTLSDRDLLLRKIRGEKVSNQHRAEVKAPMPGLVVKVLVKKGDSVKRGETLAVLEAMKMENEIRASQDSEVVDVFVRVGEIVEKDQVISIVK
jgi:acetyl/propionyl-CoA carboxylase alpha subunit